MGGSEFVTSTQEKEWADMRYLSKVAPMLMAVAVMAVASNAAPAAAHSDEGVMEVIAAEPVGADAVRIEVGVVYSNDDDLAEEAVVTADLAGPDGEVVSGVVLPRITGARYGSEIPVPVAGEWTMTIRSTNPTAEAKATVDVSAAASTTTAPSTSATPPTSIDSPASTEQSPTSDQTDDDGGEDDGGVSSAVLLAGGAVLLAIAAAAALVARRRRSGRQGGA